MNTRDIMKEAHRKAAIAVAWRKARCKPAQPYALHLAAELRSAWDHAKAAPAAAAAMMAEQATAKETRGYSRWV